MERRRAPAKELQPSQAIEECEEYHVDLASAAALELSIEPDIRQWGIRASLERLQLPVLGKRNLAPGDSAVVQNCHGREVGTASGYPLAVIWGEIVQNIFVDNLAVGTSEQILRAAFEAFGQVLTVKLVRDRDTGVPRGFAFIEMGNDAEAQAAIGALNGSTIVGQVVRVNEARPKPKDSKGIGLEMRRHREHRY